MLRRGTGCILSIMVINKGDSSKSLIILVKLYLPTCSTALGFTLREIYVPKNFGFLFKINFWKINYCIYMVVIRDKNSFQNHQGLHIN